MMKRLLLPFSLALSACTTTHSTDPNSMFFDIPVGSTLILNEPLSISGSETHATVQAGKQIDDDDRNDYAINCRLDFKKFGPRTIEPQSFSVTRTENGQNWISRPSILRFYTEIYLSSDKGIDIIKMVCQEYGGPTDRNFTVAEMQKALGGHFSFSFAFDKTE